MSALALEKSPKLKNFQVWVAPCVRAIFDIVAGLSPAKVIASVYISSLWGFLCSFISHIENMDSIHLSQNTFNQAIQPGQARSPLCSQWQRSEG